MLQCSIRVLREKDLTQLTIMGQILHSYLLKKSRYQITLMGTSSREHAFYCPLRSLCYGETILSTSITIIFRVTAGII